MLVGLDRAGILELRMLSMLNAWYAPCQLRGIMLGLKHAPVAQLDRAAASEAVGQKFESSRAHHYSSLTCSFRKLNFE